ncbi:hypothetical protein [Cellulomonas hominis]
MIRLLLRAVIFLGSAAVGLLVASWVLDDVRVSASGFVTAVVVFAVVQSVLTPFIATVARRNAPAFLGGVGLISTLVALLAAAGLTDGLSISGVQTWIVATLVVWLATALATMLLPVALLRRGRSRRVDGAPRARE